MGGCFGSKYKKQEMHDKGVGTDANQFCGMGDKNEKTCPGAYKVTPSSVSERFQGEECALEVNVLEKHNASCNFFRPNETLDGYVVIGRVIIETCGKFKKLESPLSNKGSPSPQEPRQPPPNDQPVSIEIYNSDNQEITPIVTYEDQQENFGPSDSAYYGTPTQEPYGSRNYDPGTCVPQCVRNNGSYPQNYGRTYESYPSNGNPDYGYGGYQGPDYQGGDSRNRGYNYQGSYYQDHDNQGSYNQAHDNQGSNYPNCNYRCLDNQGQEYQENNSRRRTYQGRNNQARNYEARNRQGPDNQYHEPNEAQRIQDQTCVSSCIPIDSMEQSGLRGGECGCGHKKKRKVTPDSGASVIRQCIELARYRRSASDESCSSDHDTFFSDDFEQGFKIGYLNAIAGQPSQADCLQYSYGPEFIRGYTSGYSNGKSQRESKLQHNLQTQKTLQPNQELKPKKIASSTDSCESKHDSKAQETTKYQNISKSPKHLKMEKNSHSRKSSKSHKKSKSHESKVYTCQVQKHKTNKESSKIYQCDDGDYNNKDLGNDNKDNSLMSIQEKYQIEKKYIEKGPSIITLHKLQGVFSHVPRKKRKKRYAVVK